MRRIHIEGDDLERFAELLLGTMFNDTVLDDVEGNEKAIKGMRMTLAIVKRLCLVRGVREFLSDMGDVEDFPTVFEGWNDAAMEFLGNVAEAAIKASADDDYKPGQSEKALVDFFVSKGIDEDFLDEVEALRQHEEEEVIMSVLRGDGDDLWEESHTCEGCEHCHPVEQQMEDETWYFILCPEHGRSALTQDQYTEQLLDPDRGFRCPKCDAPAKLERELDDEPA